MLTIGSIESTIPGSSTVSMSSRNSNPIHKYRERESVCGFPCVCVCVCFIFCLYYSLSPSSTSLLFSIYLCQFFPFSLVIIIPPSSSSLFSPSYISPLNGSDGKRLSTKITRPLLSHLTRYLKTYDSALLLSGDVRDGEIVNRIYGVES